MMTLEPSWSRGLSVSSVYVCACVINVISIITCSQKSRIVESSGKSFSLSEVFRFLGFKFTGYRLLLWKRNGIWLSNINNLLQY